MIGTAFIRDKKFKKKVMGTILILLICRILYCIPTPGVNPEYFQTFVEANATLGLMNALSGGSLSRMSIAALSITPYISATIVIQILSVFLPALARLAKKKTRNDEKKMERLTFAVSVVIALVESFIFSIGFGREGLLRQYSLAYVCFTALIWTGASVFLSLMGQLIQKKYFGNGVSLILFMNIVCGLPSDFLTLKAAFIDGHSGLEMTIRIILLAAVIFLVFYAAYFIQVTEKRLRVSWSGKSSSGPLGKQLDYLPIKLCPGSVMPVVFTGAVFSIPAFLFSMAGIGDHPASGFFNTSLWFRPENMFYTLGAILYALCIFFFTFLYNNMASNPIEIAEMIEKRGGTVEGRHPGAETAAYIKKETSRMLAAGGFFILAISLLPMGLSGVTGVNGIAFLGTSVLIITGTIVETYKELFAAAQPAREQKKLEKGGLL